MCLFLFESDLVVLYISPLNVSHQCPSSQCIILLGFKLSSYTVYCFIVTVAQGIKQNRSVACELALGVLLL